MRVPRVTGFTTSLPHSLAGYLISSEYATLKFLETTAVPAPRAFGHGVHGAGTDHGIGVSFLLMEELPGTSWTGDGVSGSPATDDEKAKVWNGVANILAELSKHPFPKAGSLTLQSSSLHVSAIASDRFVVLHPDGPYDSSLAYFSAFAGQYLTLIADGQLYTEYPVNAYLTYRFLKDNAAQLASKEASADRPGKFFLKHVDDKGDHLLVDENLNITGIIDWQMARVVPQCEAFGLSLVTADMSCLCRGTVSLSNDDVSLAHALRKTKSADLASFMVDEKVRRFFWGLALEPKWPYALPLANAILKVFGVDKDWAQWKEPALVEYKTDRRLQILISHNKTTVP